MTAVILVPGIANRPPTSARPPADRSSSSSPPTSPTTSACGGSCAGSAYVSYGTLSNELWETMAERIRTSSPRP